MAVHDRVAAIYSFSKNCQNINNRFTQMPTKTQKNIVIGVVILLAILFLVDRYYWAQISQWREDQATNLWLGFTRGIRNMPVGLISSRKIPNPNGMPLLGFFLSALPNLLGVSFFLGVAQIVFLLLVSWKASQNHWRYFLFAALPSLSSVILRSTSVEFWNQYVITSLNIFFIFWAIRYLQDGSLWNLPPIAFLILLAPSLYLAGIINAVTIALLTIGLIAYKRPNLSNLWAVSIIIIMLVLLSVFITWLPYFRNISVEQVIQSSRLKADPVSSLPLAFEQADVRILSLPARILLNIANRAYLIQAVFASATFLYALFYSFLGKKAVKDSDSNKSSSYAPLIVLSGLFIILSYALSAALGGADWLRNRRPDQTVQFLPMFLFLIFLLPFSTIRSAKAGQSLDLLAGISLAVFVTVNLLCGFMIIRDQLQYRGNILTDADIPLVNKMQAVDFIASDWKNYSGSKIIPVDYDLGGGKWDWIPKFGKKLTKWYSAPMTIGRSFDYELLRRFGLTNEQEGIQLRTFGNGRYLVTYAFENLPQVANGQVRHYIFGRLRVSVVDK
jgi:hypothetical protein